MHGDVVDAVLGEPLACQLARGLISCEMPTRQPGLLNVSSFGVRPPVSGVLARSNTTPPTSFVRCPTGASTSTPALLSVWR